MSTLLYAAPGEIGGLCRQWSPLLITLPTGRVVRGTLRNVEPMSDGQYRLWAEDDLGGTMSAPASQFQLDLTDAAGRWDAARWCFAHHDAWEATEDEALDLAMQGTPMSPERIDVLARLVLRLAGRSA